jgi:inner membrane protein involved in colicin E2 resistance
MLIPLLSHGTEFIWILIASLVLQVLVLIPLAAITLRPLRSATSRAVSVGIALVTLAVLVWLSMSVLLSDDFGPIAAVSVVLMSLVFPFYVMLLAAREHHLNIVSGWFPQELLH